MLWSLLNVFSNHKFTSKQREAINCQLICFRVHSAFRSLVEIKVKLECRLYIMMYDDKCIQMTNSCF